MNKDAESFYQFLLDVLDVPPGYECNIEFDEEKGEIYAIKTPKREKVVNCDNCQHYRWYYDRCEKWGCEVDGRAVRNCFEERAKPIRDMMVNPKEETE